MFKANAIRLFHLLLDHGGVIYICPYFLKVLTQFADILSNISVLNGEILISP